MLLLQNHSSEAQVKVLNESDFEDRRETGDEEFSVHIDLEERIIQETAH